MVYKLKDILDSKPLRRTLAEAAAGKTLEFQDGNGVFDLDFSQQSLLVNHRTVYDRLCELGGEKLLKKLLNGGETCLTNDAKAAKQGVRPIAGTEKFFLLTNVGAPKAFASIAFGLAGWAAMDKSFDPALVTVTEQDSEVVDAFFEENAELIPDDGWEPLDPNYMFNTPALLKPPAPAFTVETCLGEPDENNVAPCIIRQDGWFAVADVEQGETPVLRKLRTPLAFTSLYHPAAWDKRNNQFKNFLMAEQFGRKGAYNWVDNQYVVPCEYDSIALHETLSYAWTCTKRMEKHTMTIFGIPLNDNRPACPKCGKPTYAEALYCHMCGHFLERPRKIDENVPTSETFKEKFRAGGRDSQLRDNELKVELRFNDTYAEDTRPESYLYADLHISFNKENGGKEISRLTQLAAYALNKDGICYARNGKIFFLNIYGDMKELGSQDKVISMSDNGNGTVTVTYVTNLCQTAYNQHEDLCGYMYEAWYDIYHVNTATRIFTYKDNKDEKK